MPKQRSHKGRVLNWTPDLPDQRDLIFSGPPKAPPLIDLRAQMPGVYNQGTFSSCSWNAICSVLGYLQLKQLKQAGKQAQEYDESTYIAPSRLFGYYNARALIGMQASDSGAYIRDGVKTANQQGVCRETLWPYLSQNVFKKPNPFAYKEAAEYKISKYMRITNLQDMKGCLSDGFPFVFGFSVYDSFYNIGKDGVVKMPLKGETLYGGHAVTAVGFNDAKQIFIVRNSWGSTWADKGHCYFPYQYLNSNLSSDFWTIRN